MLENITIDELSGDQKELAECIGIEAYRLLVRYYGGSMIYISQAKTLIRSDRDAMIKKDYNGKNIRELSRKYNLSISAIRRIINSNE